MYQAPDFVKVSVKAKDVFSSYASNCVPAVWHGTGSVEVFMYDASDRCAGGPAGENWMDGYKFTDGEWAANCFLHKNS